jgi:hypothetical protein
MLCDSARREAAVLTVYLWDTGTWCGVTDSLEDAQHRAVERLDEDGHARVEAAWVVLGVFSLVRCYERTGQAWTARSLPDGTVFWTPAESGRLRRVS